MKAFLDRLQEKYHEKKFLTSDPLEFVHLYSDPLEQEAVALVSALLAYGKVKQIRHSVSDLLTRMTDHSGSPRAFVRSLEKPSGGRAELANAIRGQEGASKALKGFVHRFNTGEDLVQLLVLLSRSWKEHGSLGAHFVSYLNSDDAHIGSALSLFIADWRSKAPPSRSRTSFSYLLNSPADGSCCKRWCMFLRWMGRKDSLDPGLWTVHGSLASTFPAGKFLRPDQLIIPLDTHTGRISQYLLLTSRKSLNWKAAVEVTDNLRRQCNSEDPVRYDFALSRLGILDFCQRKYRPEICKSCDLLPVCKYAQGKALDGNR